MSIEKTLFAAADKMRGAMDAGEYKLIALGLLFLRYVSEAFERRHALIAEECGDPEDRDEYLAENTFVVPPSARWSTLAAQSKDARIIAFQWCSQARCCTVSSLATQLNQME